MTEQTKINISLFVFDMMKSTKATEVGAYAGNQNNGPCQTVQKHNGSG